MSQAALVVGGSSGIGAALTAEYTGRGWRVVSTYRGSADEPQHPRQDRSPTRMRLDVTDRVSMQAARHRLREVGHRFDVVVYCAGLSRVPGMSAGDAAGSVLDLSMDAVQELMSVNFIGAIASVQMVQDVLAPGARLVFLSSNRASLSLVDDGGSTPYAASKTALNMLVRKLAYEKPELTVVAVHPGWVRTRIGGDKAPLSPESAADSLVGLIDTLHIGMTGSFVDSGGRRLPW